MTAACSRRALPAGFDVKLGKVQGPTNKTLAFHTPILDPDCALTAQDAWGTLMGVIGPKPNMTHCFREAVGT